MSELRTSGFGVSARRGMARRRNRPSQRHIGLSGDCRDLCSRQLDRLRDLVADLVKGRWQA